MAVVIVPFRHRQQQHERLSSSLRVQRNNHYRKRRSALTCLGVFVAVSGVFYWQQRVVLQYQRDSLQTLFAWQLFETDISQPPPPATEKNQRISPLLRTLFVKESSLWQLLPIVPSFHRLIPETSNNDDGDMIQKYKALTDIFQYATNKSTTLDKHHRLVDGGWIHVNTLSTDDIDRLRHLGRIVMARNTTCLRNAKGKKGLQPLVSGLEHCFWENDLVSRAAMRSYGFERALWGWVLTQFQVLEQEQQQQHQRQKSAAAAAAAVSSSSSVTSTSSSYCHLAFLDIGVNVGDWASPLRMALPDATPYFGIEGSPATAAIATANLRTSIEHVQRLSNGSDVGPTALLPFSLLSKRMIPSVQASGGVCFEDVSWNLGSQGLASETTITATTTTTGNTGSSSSTSMIPCEPSLVAGGTLLPHALQALLPLQQQQASSTACRGHEPLWPLDWPRIYIAKLDIEGFEFKALVSAMDWLLERPPCYLTIEFHPRPQNSAILELLLDVGYDSLWRSHNSFALTKAMVHDEFPSTTSRPFWSKSQNSSTLSLHDAVQADMTTVAPGYKDYIFGFEHRTECLRRLLE